MTFATRPVVSGKPYLVRTVRDQRPRALRDFAGDTCFVIDLDGEDYTVWGPGVETGDLVRVYEKSDEGAGKDIRVWCVAAGKDGSFAAMHGGIDVPPQAVAPRV